MLRGPQQEGLFWPRFWRGFLEQVPFKLSLEVG